VLKLRLNKDNTFPRIRGSISHTIPTTNRRSWGCAGRRRMRSGSARGRKGGGRKRAAHALLTQRCRARRGGAARLSHRCMWRGRPGPTSAPRVAARHHGTPVASLHVARQSLCAAPRRQARPKGSPGANNVFQGLILKII
jgi:hypothetical protein